ncbi:large conductance mechanosensitive channel protein MscL [Paenalcaligenes niemegkensis]|uniref:large conductance mechanosensitive channel protein MscL n=1 Tax=Paenalcaligenes niemegkensis TaxID=2895469 RepID=UPI001EE95943|nr:large conductance mechanosensitive channel protein MscL [Paenalcaligenes niemegkensis]MCQ9618116.1 large conductance mechanosensitive channel protein MscL [Paenalcaligenes niemegkensis]
MGRTSGFIHEFREFAVKGNMIDLAVGVIIGGAFGKIIDSLVKDLFMPLISFILGGEVDFSNKFLVLREPEGYTGPQTIEALNEAGAVVLSWGNFLTIFINFILLAFVVFCMVKMVNRMRAAVHHEEKQAEAAAPAPTPEDIVLLREIRDSLQTPPNTNTTP